MGGIWGGGGLRVFGQGLRVLVRLRWSCAPYRAHLFIRTWTRGSAVLHPGLLAGTPFGVLEAQAVLGCR